MIAPKFHTTPIIRMSKWDKLIDKLFQQPPTIAELGDKEFLAYRAVTQGNCFRRVG